MKKRGGGRGFKRGGQQRRHLQKQQQQPKMDMPEPFLMGDNLSHPPPFMGPPMDFKQMGERPLSPSDLHRFPPPHDRRPEIRPLMALPLGPPPSGEPMPPESRLPGPPEPMLDMRRYPEPPRRLHPEFRRPVAINYDPDDVRNYRPPPDLPPSPPPMEIPQDVRPNTSPSPVSVASPSEEPQSQPAEAPADVEKKDFNQLWAEIQENPHDFSLWSNLLTFVESELKGNLDAQRGVLNAFLPLYPYCFVYWKKYADLEASHGNKDRALSILERGLDAIPLSVDLWMTYLLRFIELHGDVEGNEEKMRNEYENALATAGLEFRSDALWTSYIKWEIAGGRLKRAVRVYRRLLSTPTKLHKKHWDNFLTLIRKNSPEDMLSEGEYKELLRSIGAAGSGVDLGKVKEAMIAKWLPYHEANTKEVEKRWKYEEKIKRPYFHVKPLDLKQLKNWREYLDFEIEAGDYERIVVLFERCLIACAHYEEFWCRYARYMETVKSASSTTTQVEETKTGEAEDEMKDKVEEASEDIDAAVKTENPEDGSAPMPEQMETDATSEVKPTLDADVIKSEVKEEEELKAEETKVDVQAEPKVVLQTEHLPPPGKLGVKAGLDKVPGGRLEAVRQIYRRACVVHCPRWPHVKLQWALFEEEKGDVSAAANLISEVVQVYPAFIAAKVQGVELERRRSNFDAVDKMFAKYTGEATTPEVRSFFAIQHSRFTFKNLGQPDKALGVLRKALKQDRGNADLFKHVLDICYQRYPVDVKGYCAATELAIMSKDLSLKHKVEFAEKRVYFLREFGSLAALRQAEDAWDRLKKSYLESDDVVVEGDVVKPAMLTRSSQTRPLDEVLRESRKREGGGDSPPEVSDDDFDRRIAADGDRRDGRWRMAKKRRRSPPPTRHYGPSHRETSRGSTPVVEVRYPRGEPPVVRVSPPPAAPPLLASHARPPPAPALLPDRRLPPPPIETLPPPVQDVERVGPPPPAPQPPPPPLGVPEWFIRDGGEFVIESSAAGKSSLRYWPRFMTDHGNARIMRSLEKIIAWQPRRMSMDGTPRLCAWFGPCPYENEDLGFRLESTSPPPNAPPGSSAWPEEMLNLLHRLISFCGKTFNAVMADYFRSSRDCLPWHSEEQAVIGHDSVVGIVVLGTMRQIELTSKRDKSRILRFPLFPGSLLVMEGATQKDWLHQLPPDLSAASESIILTFRVMYGPADAPPGSFGSPVGLRRSLGPPGLRGDDFSEGGPRNGNSPSDIASSGPPPGLLPLGPPPLHSVPNPRRQPPPGFPPLWEGPIGRPKSPSLMGAPRRDGPPMFR